MFATPSMGLHFEYMLGTVIYAFIGLLLLLAFTFIFDKLMGIDFKKELFEDQNTALGIWLAGLSIGMAIIIAASIHG